MKIQKIDFEKIWTIYEEAFPHNERRSWDLQIDIQNNPAYDLYPLWDAERIIGLIGTWDLDDFLFIEHYAIDNKCRGQGYGKSFLKRIIEETDKTIVLEVEKPENEISIKRIEFYKGLGFHCNPYNYLQPSYGKGKDLVPLLVMSYPQAIVEDDFDGIRDRLYREVYKHKL